MSPRSSQRGAGHRQPAPSIAAQHRIGVGVVAVVDQRAFASVDHDTAHLRAAAHGPEGGQAVGDGAGRATRCECRCSGCERVAHVVATGRMQGEGDGAGRRLQRDLPMVVEPVGIARHVGAGRSGRSGHAGNFGNAGRNPVGRVVFRFASGVRETRCEAACRAVGERQHAARARLRQPGGRMFVVGRKHGDAIVAQRLDGSAVLPCHRIHAAHELEMLALRVVDEHDRRRSDRGEPGDLADVVHAELDHAGAMTGAQAQQGERHADVVVEIAFGGERALASPGAKDRGNHLRHRGLAVAAGHGGQRQIEATAPRRGQIAEGDARIGDLDAGETGLVEPALGQGCDRTSRLGFGEEVVGVEALAAQGHEKIAGAQGSRIAVHAVECDARVADETRAREQAGQLADRQHGCFVSRQKRCGGMFGIGERELLSRDVLIVLVALAGQQHHIGRRRRADRMGDRFGAVLEHVDFVVTDCAGKHLRDDEVGWLVARVVAGDDDAVGKPRRQRAHHRPLGSVAVAAAAEQAPEPAAALDGQWAQRLQRFLERVGRVRIVDHDLGDRRPARVGRCGMSSGGRGRPACVEPACPARIDLDPDALHAARHRRHGRAGSGGFVQRDPERAQDADDDEQIRGVVVADQGRGDSGFRATFAQIEGQALRLVANPFGAQPCRAAHRHGPNVDAGPCQRCRQSLALRIVDVDDGRAQPGPGEELRLGLPVGRHVAVVVEMVLREVGERGDGDARSRQAMLGQSDRRRLDSADGEAACREVGEDALQGDRLGRRQAGRHDSLHRLARPAAGPPQGRPRPLGGQRTQRAWGLTDPQRAHHGRPLADRAQRLRDPPRCRRLAVGAGDSDDIDPLAGPAVEVAGDLAGGRLQPLQRGDARFAAQGKPVDAVGLDEAGRRAGRKRIADMAACVGDVARPRDEGIARHDAAAVARQRVHLSLLQPGMGRLGRVEPQRRGSLQRGH